MSDFNDVGAFHRKFGLRTSSLFISRGNAPSMIDDATREFRLKFLREELKELEEAYDRGDLVHVADALVDLVYVALGTAHLHGLPWPELFAAVQAANMAKVRCEIDHKFRDCREDAGCPECVEVVDADASTGKPVFCRRPKHEHSARGSSLDVIKPQGWRAPDLDIEKILELYGYKA